MASGAYGFRLEPPDLELFDTELFDTDFDNELFDAESDTEFEADFEVDRRAPRYLRWVQQSLNRLMNAGLVVDGVNGRLTRRAVRAFQRRRGLSVDGRVGPRTEAALRAAGAPAPPQATVPSPSPRPTTPTPRLTPMPRRRCITSSRQLQPLLSPRALERAAAQNLRLARSLGWLVLYDAIASWILNFGALSPSIKLFSLAVANWQQAKGLPPNGVLDAATWLVMLREAKRGRSPTLPDPGRGDAAPRTRGDPRHVWQPRLEPLRKGQHRKRSRARGS